MKLNKKLISSFRDKVNSNSNFVYNKYRNINNTNYWGIICSCMDWISVSARFLTSKRNLNKDIDVRVMELFSVISAIDIIVESVNQLHRVFFNTQEIPFSDESDIFLNNQLGLPDNEYFKELRAMFGAHPVNLKHKDNKRWYASWPHEPFSTKNTIFDIRLYSNEIGVKDLTFGINIIELESFAVKHYNHLISLKKEIDKQISDFSKQNSKIKIENKENIKDILKVLKEESIKRFNNDYYNESIDGLITIFNTTLHSKELAEEEKNYKNELLKVVNEIKSNLQSMNIVDLITDKILNPDYPYDNIAYSISKLYTYDFDSRKEPLYNFHLKKLDEFSNDIYQFKGTKTKDKIILKLKMMLYRFNTKGFS